MTSKNGPNSLIRSVVVPETEKSSYLEKMYIFPPICHGSRAFKGKLVCFITGHISLASEVHRYQIDYCDTT